MKNKENPFVPYQIAFLLKEKGFNRKCYGYYGNIDKEFYRCKIGTVDFIRTENIIAPFYQQVTDWLREEHDIHVLIETMQEWTYDLIRVSTKEVLTPQNEHWYHETYYKALDKAITEALKII